MAIFTYLEWDLYKIKYFLDIIYYFSDRRLVVLHYRVFNR